MDGVRRIENDSTEVVLLFGEAELVIDRRKGAEFEAGDVSEDGGASDGDAVFDGEARD